MYVLIRPWIFYALYAWQTETSWILMLSLLPFHQKTKHTFSSSVHVYSLSTLIVCVPEKRKIENHNINLSEQAFIACQTTS